MKMNVIMLRVSRLLLINYSYLIFNPETGSAVLVDPAWEEKKFTAALAENNLTLKAILLTHHHFDHINLANKFAKKYNVPAFMSRTEIDYYHFSCHSLQAIESEDSLPIDDIAIQPIFSPGHTKGGTSYLIDDNFFCGDTLFIEGCGLCYGNGANPEIMFDTLQKYKQLLLPSTRIFPGHSYGDTPGQSFDYVLNHNVYLQFTDKDSFVAFRMREGQKGLFNFK